MSLNNQDIKSDFEQWLKELTIKSQEYDKTFEKLEKEIRLLRVRNRVLDGTSLVIEHSENVKATYIQSEKESNLQDIKSKEQELINLQENEWKKVYQIRKLIENVKNEIHKIEASE